MAQVIIYTGSNCPYCQRAKLLLQKRKALFTEFNISLDPEQSEEMLKKSGGKKTVPQIFIGDKHIGGCDDLHALDAAGKLEPMLKGP